VNQLVQPAQVVQPLAPVTPESFQVVMGVVMAVWAGAFVLQQVIKVIKGEEIEKPPVIPK